MNHQLSSSTLLLIIIFHIPSTSTHAPWEPPCLTQFKCGNIKSGYPFWGELRGKPCGHPQMLLKCKPHHSPSPTTTMTLNDVNYRVLKIDTKSHTLTIARILYHSNQTCTNLRNTTFDTRLFKYNSDHTYKTATLLYRCDQNNGCKLNGVGYDGRGIQARGGIGGGCDANVSVPVLDSLVRKTYPNVSLVEWEGIINSGFVLKWRIDGIACEDCQINSLGVCGYDVNYNKTICYCPHKTTPPFYGETTCPAADQQLPQPGVLPPVVGAVVATAVGLALISILIFCFIRNRRKNPSLSETSDTSKDPYVSTTIRANCFNQTISAFPFTKKDIQIGSKITHFLVKYFDYNELEKATENFHPSKELGNGGFGTVYYGVLNDGTAIAVKRFYENNLNHMDQFMNEVEILSTLRHRNLVTLLGYTSRHNRELILVYEYIPNGTVSDHIHTNSALLPWPIRLTIALETATALAFLHSSEVIHCDVKTKNILVDNNFQVKVADFGLSRFLPIDTTHVSTAPQGTPGYVDPEYYKRYQLTYKSDVYSFGVVLIELISSLQAVDMNRGKYDVNLGDMAVSKIQNHALGEIVDPALRFDEDYGVRFMVTSVAELAFRCLQQEREMRPTMQEVLDVLRGIYDEHVHVVKVEDVGVDTDGDSLLKSSTAPPISLVCCSAHVT